ncbi:MAG: transporter [Pseudomonas sp.]|uniref:MFS transporter n=1 Tax=Pseudomonas sp. TaxID=306 RepID=UPI002623CC1E|nr:MFS transporter [Pseudomonas sp.]MDB6052009.1 transporter [Pseudomonas sp.]
MTADVPALTPFSRYQKFVVGLLATLQFAVIIDFMLMAPLGAMIMPALSMSTRQFGLVVSAYAFSAGLSGLLTAGFADRFDRKKLLLFFYSGFVIGTLWCGLATSFETLLLARVVTGVFAGVIGSIVLAIAADLFAPQSRGRVMGVIQTAFAASQVLGLPVGLYLANHWGWHAPFLLLAAMGAAGGLVIVLAMRPVADHLAARQEHTAFRHLFNTLATRRHWAAFAATALLTTGGYMLMPFSSAFTVNNLGIDITSLPTVYLFTGLCTIVTGPLIGRASDAFGKLPVFYVGSALTIIMVTIYTHLPNVPLPWVVLVNAVLFVGIFSRLIPFQAMVAGVPEPSHRGAFNAVSSAIQQLSGGFASLLAGHIVLIGVDGKLQHFDVVGYLLVATTLIAGYLVWRVQRGLLVGN